MERTEASGSHADLSDIVDLIVRYIDDIKKLALLSACSKRCRVAVKECVAETFVSRLSQAVQSAYFVVWNEESKHRRLYHSIAWLLVSVHEFPPDAAGHVLLLPRVGLDGILLDGMLEHGFKYTLDQLVTAAKHRVPGLECWVPEETEWGGTPTNLPSLVEEIMRQDPSFFEVRSCSE